MKLSDLQYDFPNELIATEPQRPSRVLWTDSEGPKEINMSELLKKFSPKDVLVINDTKVLKRRVFAGPEGETEILFLEKLSPERWQVLFPASRFELGAEISLPGQLKARLIEKGRPQILETSTELTEAYFDKVAELPLPPYIQKMRKERHSHQRDPLWYQSAWASQPGSLAAPTASLHFSHQDLAQLQAQGVQVLSITLHVGLGTFLPVQTEELSQHPMHSEQVFVSEAAWKQITEARLAGAKIWALGTTVARALESVAANKLKAGELGHTDLFIYQGFQWQVLDRLLTNFHQPESTLLALVASFAGLENVLNSYRFAIDNRFRLFSYGDLSVWSRN